MYEKKVQQDPNQVQQNPNQDQVQDPNQVQQVPKFAKSEVEEYNHRIRKENKKMNGVEILAKFALDVIFVWIISYLVCKHNFNKWYEERKREDFFEEEYFKNIDKKN